MKELKVRSVKELYNVSEEVLEPKLDVTPVLKGGCRIQGHADEADRVVWMNMGSSGTGKRFGRHLPGGKFHSRVESGTCNVCAIPCSSCMHFNRVASLKGSKTDEFSDEVCQEKAASRCSFNDADLLSPFMSRACDDRQHTSSERSNLLSACSSHDSFSENAESKATLRVSHIFDDIEMLPKVTTGQTVAEDRGFPEPQIFHGNRIFSNQHEKQKDLECHGDNISCISGADGANMMVDDHNGDADRKNVSCSSASVNSFCVAGDAANVQPASHCLASNHCDDVGHDDSSTPINFTKESLQETVVFSNKSDTSDFSSFRYVCAGASSPKGEPSECSAEQVESSSARVATFRFGGHKDDVHDSAKSVKPDTKMDDGDTAAEVVNCSDQKQHFEKSSALLEVPSVQEPPLQSQPVDSNDGSDVLEDEVKVCDICGDAGREELLAICSKCSDGAEHTYCMRVKLDKVPEGDWVCEECMLREESEKRKQDKLEKVVGSSKGSFFNELSPNSGNSSAFHFKNCLDVDNKDSKVEKSRTNKVGSTPHFSAKRPAGNLEAASVTKRRALETSVGSSRVSSPCRKALLSRDSSSKNLDMGKMKLAHQKPSFCDHSSNNTLENAHSPTTKSHNSPKIQPRVQKSRGSLFKSNSFNILDSKLKVQLPEEDIFQKQKFARETATSDRKKEGIVRMMSKSMSFNNASSDRSNATDSKVKMPSSYFSRVENLEGLRLAKEQNSTQRKYGTKIGKPLLSSPMAGSGVSGSETDKKIASRMEAIVPVSSGTNCRDLKAVQCHGNLNDSSKSTSNLVHKGSKYPNDLAGSGGVKRPSSCLSNVVRDPSSGMFDSSHKLKPNQVILKDKLTSSSSWTDNRHCGSPDATLQDSLPQSRESSIQDGKARDTSYFSRPGQNISAGSKSVNCYKCNEIGRAAESCPICSPSGSVLDARSSKEVNNNNKTEDVAEATTITRHELHKKHRFPGQSDELSKFSSNLNYGVASKDCLSTYSSCLRNPFSSDGRNEVRDRVVNDVRRRVEHSTEAAFAIRAQNSNAIISSDERPYMRDLPSAVAVPSRTSAVPEFDYIWHGGFGMQRSRRLPSSCDGIQAHLSTCASPKVLKVVNKFPRKILLEEVPRLSTWPSQFLENRATEDNIGLYFFAEDIGSYGRSYKRLLECMIKNDLALKGTFDGIELLIFSSNLLPERSQRWNAMSFLWGVFRGRRVNYSEHMPSSTMKICVPNLNVVPPDQDLSVPAMSGSQNMCSSGQLSECLSASNISYNSLQASNPIASVELPSVCTGRMDRICEPKVSSEQQNLGLQTKFDQQLSRVGTISLSSIPMKTEQSSREMQHTSTSLKEHKYPERRLEVERKPCPQGSGENNVDSVTVDEENKCKRVKSCFNGMYECNSSGDAKYTSGRFPSGINGHGPSFPIEDHRCDVAYNMEITDNARITGRSLFSSDPGPVDGRLGVKSREWQVLCMDDGEDQMESGVPNLELSLGAEKKSAKQGIMPSSFGIVDNENNQDEHLNPVANNKINADELSASLTLSLALPFSDKEQVSKPDSKTKQLLPERHGMNTSLSL